MQGGRDEGLEDAGERESSALKGSTQSERFGVMRRGIVLAVCITKSIK